MRASRSSQPLPAARARPATAGAQAAWSRGPQTSTDARATPSSASRPASAAASPARQRQRDSRAHETQRSPPARRPRPGTAPTLGAEPLGLRPVGSIHFAFGAGPAALALGGKEDGRCQGQPLAATFPLRPRGRSKGPAERRRPPVCGGSAAGLLQGLAPATQEENELVGSHMALAAAAGATASQPAALAAAVEALPTYAGKQNFLGFIAGQGAAGVAAPAPEEEFERAAEALERQIGQLREGSFPPAPDSLEENAQAPSAGRWREAAAAAEALDRSGEALDRSGAAGSVAAALLRRSVAGGTDQQGLFPTSTATAGSPAALARPASAPALRPARAPRSAQEQRWILQQYKYVRKVEPDVPPIGQLLFDDPPAEAPPADQRLVQYNASSTALRRWSPEARAEGRAAAQDERGARHLEAARRRRRGLERRELELRRRAACEDQRADPHDQAAAWLDPSRAPAGPVPGQWLLLHAVSASAGGRRRAAPSSAQPAGCAQPALQIPSFAGLWLTLAAVAGFAKQARMEAEFKKCPSRERMNYVQDSSRRGWARSVAQSRLSTPMTVFVREALQLDEKMRSSAFQMRRMMLEDMLSCRCQIWRRRRQASKVVTCLSSWSTTGRLFARLQSIKRDMVRLQRWWRVCRPRLHQALDEVERHFVRVEREQLKLELRAEEEDKAPGSRRKAGEMAQLMQTRTVQGKFRQLFLQHELRVRRYFLLPAIAVWEADFCKWRSDMQGLMASQAPVDRAASDGQGGDGVPDADGRRFVFPPDRPSYVPSEDLEMRRILLRARQAEAEGEDGEWAQQLSRRAGASASARPFWRNATTASLRAAGGGVAAAAAFAFAASG